MSNHKGDDDAPVGTKKTAVAQDIENLKDTILRFARDRERLPQPLFWSLFNSRLKEIKKSKEVSRILQEALGGGDDV